LLVDGVSAFSSEPLALHASRHVSPCEPVFAGHFPDRSVWPGAYTVEGLAQCCALAGALAQVERALAARQPPLELAALAALDAWPPAAGEAGAWEEALGGARGRPAVLAAVDVKLTRPVLPGQRIDYRVALTHQVDRLHRFDVEATVGGQLVARGTLTTAAPESP
jgi:3-hydroxymyristoyl/3-hydroxydecanoyl-(acyl carrier protein) dehydratase